MVAFPLAHISWALADNRARKACDGFLRDVFAAETVYEVLMDSQAEALGLDREQTLLAIGDTVLASVAPAGPGLRPESAIGEMLRDHARLGRWIGLALSVADLDAARDWVRAKGLAPKSYPVFADRYFLLDREDALGVRLEFLKGDLRNDPRLKPGWRPQWWRDEHPLGLEGLQSVGVSAPSLNRAREVFAGRFEWPEVSSRRLSDENAACATFLVGDNVIEAMAPLAEDSGLARHSREVRGIYCLTFQVRSAAAAADYLRGAGFSLIGDPASRFAIEPEQAFGRLLYFTDTPLKGRPPFRSLISQPAVFRSN